MDFHSLSRRELQALCKKNKIPANITNVAMADALKALEIVEGMEEFMQPTQSESAQSSIESPTRLEVTSPYVPPTAGRTTRRTNLTKEEPATVNPTTRTRRTTRKTLKEADALQADLAIVTPALATQTNRRKGLMTSVSRKMDSQLKECVDEEKKDALDTPAVRGLTSRRRAVKEDSAVKRVYSTRRSVRLADNNVDMVSEMENEETEALEKELPTEEGENEGQNDFNETSGITGMDAVTTIEVKSEKDNSEVVSALKKNITFVEEEECINVVAEVDLGKCENTENPQCEIMDCPLNLSNEVHQTEGSYDVCISDIEFTVDSSEEMNTEDDAQSEEIKAADDVQNAANVAPESKDNIVENREEMNTENYAQSEEMKAADCAQPAANVALESKDNIIENREEMNTEEDPESEEKLADFESKDNFEADEFSGETGFPDEIENDFCSDKDDVNSEDVPDINATLVKFTELGLQQATNQDEPEKTEILQLEEPKKAAADLVPSELPYDGETAEIAVASANKKPSYLTPTKNSARKKASEELKRMSVFSDNKENIGSANKLVVLEDKVKIAAKTTDNADNLHEMSMRKLTKMLKEKLEITKKSNKTEHGNEQGHSRQALQALPENRRLVDETQN